MFEEEVFRMKEELKEVNEEQKSFTMELFQDYKKVNRRWFVCWLITFVAFVCLLIYTIWLQSDITTIETTETTQEISDIYTIENSTIRNGD